MPSASERAMPAICEAFSRAAGLTMGSVKQRRVGMLAAMSAPMQKRIASLGLSALVATVSLAASAQTQPDPGMPKVNPYSASGVFGGRGQLAIMGEGGVVFSHTSIKGTSGSATTVVFQPAIDYFVIDHLSLGVFSGVQYERSTPRSTTVYRIGPRIGYDIPFSDRFSIWPQAGLSFNNTTVKIDGINGGPDVSNSNGALAINLYAPIMFHANHYFAGLGPSLDTDVTGDAKNTTVAIRLVLGGWLF